MLNLYENNKLIQIPDNFLHFKIAREIAGRYGYDVNREPREFLIAFTTIYNNEGNLFSKDYLELYDANANL